MKNKFVSGAKNQPTSCTSYSKLDGDVHHDTACSRKIELDVGTEVSDEASHKRRNIEIEQEGQALLKKAILSWTPASNTSTMYSDRMALLHRVVQENINHPQEKKHLGLSMDKIFSYTEEAKSILLQMGKKENKEIEQQDKTTDSSKGSND
jgi:hypothetical protein